MHAFGTSCLSACCIPDSEDTAVNNTNVNTLQMVVKLWGKLKRGQWVEGGTILDNKASLTSDI